MPLDFEPPLPPPEPVPPAPGRLRQKLEALGQTALLIFILASAAFLSAITAMRIAIHGREVTMPNLVGKSVSEANSMLRSRGLLLRVADRVYSDSPINVVVRQTPPAGSATARPGCLKTDRESSGKLVRLGPEETDV